MWGSVNGHLFGSPAGDAEVKKILQPLLNQHPAVMLGYNEFNSITLNFLGHSMVLEAVFDGISEAQIVENLEPVLKLIAEEHGATEDYNHGRI